MGEAIAIVSGKGGAGKTTATAYIGIALAVTSKKVLLIDGNFGLRNLDLLLELENDAVYNLLDIISGFCEKDEVILKHPFYENVSFLPCPQTKKSDAVSIDAMKKMVEDLKEDYDYILIDCPGGLEKGFQLGITAADRAIVVSELSALSIRNTDSVIQDLKKTGLREIHCLINKVNQEAIRKGEAFDFQTFFEIIYEPLIGVFFQSDAIEHLLFRGRYFEDLPREEQSWFFNVAKRISGEEIPLPPIASKPSEEDGMEVSFDRLFQEQTKGNLIMEDQIKEDQAKEEQALAQGQTIIERLKELFINRKE